MIRRQRSHILFVLSHPKSGCEAAFVHWYQGAYRHAVLNIGGILSVQHYERHEVDIDQGQHPPLPFNYLAFYELSIDGAQAADGIIERIAALHQDETTAQAPATWLYYPVSEKVGRSPAT